MLLGSEAKKELLLAEPPDEASCTERLLSCFGYRQEQTDSTTLVIQEEQGSSIALEMTEEDSTSPMPGSGTVMLVVKWVDGEKVPCHKTWSCSLDCTLESILKDAVPTDCQQRMKSFAIEIPPPGGVWQKAEWRNTTLRSIYTNTSLTLPRRITASFNEWVK